MTDEKPQIKVGDHVRSFDFPDLPGMKTTCYVEGIVEAIGQVPEVGGCDRYTIRITRRVWKGHEDDAWRRGKEFPTGRCYPPVNGVPMWTGGVTDHVKLLPPPEPTPQPADPTGGERPQVPASGGDSSPTWSQLATGRKALVADLEKHLREEGWPYVAVDDAKKAIFASGNIKAFDHLIYSSSGSNLLVLVITRRPTAEQVEQMQEWQKVFGNDFQAVFMFQAGGQWRLVSLKDLQTPDPLAHSRSLEEYLTQTQTNEGSNP